MAKPAAFNPTPYKELSVGHSTHLDDAAIWQLGDTVRQLLGRDVLLARADLEVHHVTENKLKAIRDDADFDRHTNIVGWPEIADDDTRKRTWKGIAADLANKSKLHLAGGES